MATMEKKMVALTKLMHDGILTAEDFANVVATLNGGLNATTPAKEKSELEKRYDDVFSKHIAEAKMLTSSWSIPV